MQTSFESPRIAVNENASIETGKSQKIWIDLDNSPHVPLFTPIIDELRRRGHSVFVTARDCFQVKQLTSLFGVECEVVGRHYGQYKLLKAMGLGIRALQLAPLVLHEKPDLALSHGSRTQLLVCAALRLPAILMMDYEFAAGLTVMRPEWVMLPEAIPDSAVSVRRGQILRYAGIKEDVYVPGFQPDSRIFAELDIKDDELVVTLRPPATEAHYHNPESEVLLRAVIEHLCNASDVKTVLLPRNERQEDLIRKEWSAPFETGKIMVPPKAVDGLNLIWHSDLVISGGGTMNREAAALGVPVYSIFRGRIGAVDRYLADTGRLTLIENVDDVDKRISLRRRDRSQTQQRSNNKALCGIIGHIQNVFTQLSHRSEK